MIKPADIEIYDHRLADVFDSFDLWERQLLVAGADTHGRLLIFSALVRPASGRITTRAQQGSRS
jgi:hypothetical protein